MNTNNVSHTPDSIVSSNNLGDSFENKKPFDILSIFRATTTQSTAADTNMCKGWEISDYELHRIIYNSRAISGTEWDLTFDVLPCIARGIISQSGNNFEFEINAGSWLYIRCKDTTILYGNFSKLDRKYFVSFPDTK